MPGRKPAVSGDPLAHLEDGPHTVYAIDGEERILVDEAVALIKSKSLSPKAKDFNLDVFIPKETPMSRIVDAAMTLPAFAPLRLVIVKDADRIVEKDADTLISYVEKPSPTTVLLLIGEKFDARTKLYKSLQKHGTALRFMHPKDREMPGIAKQRAKMLGVAIDDHAVRALVEAVGTDIGQLKAALEKLALYIGPGSGRAIQREDVEAVVSHAKEESMFALTDAIGDGDLRSSLSHLHSLLVGSREHPLALLGLIAMHWRRLTRAKALAESGVRPGEMASALGIPPFIVDKVLAQSRRHTPQGLAKGLSAIAQADQALKGGRLSGARVMEQLVLTLAER